MVYRPVTISRGQNPLIQFDGLITTHFLEPPEAPPGTAFQIKQVYRPIPATEEGAEASHAYRGPPLHFHAHQTERFRVLKGRVGIEINEKIIVLRPDDGVAVCPAGNIHRFFIDVNDDHEKQHALTSGKPQLGAAEDDDGETVLMVNATDSGKDFMLDRVFLENWYAVRVDSFKYYGGLDFIQQCATFDGGDHYLPFPSALPSWVPLDWSVYIRTILGWWLTIIVGRYIGGFLGYTPFYREYTTDWEVAQAKMEHTWFYRKNLHYSYKTHHAWSNDQLRNRVWSDDGAATMGATPVKSEKRKDSVCSVY